MGVERDRVGELEPGESLASAVGEAGERSVGAVDVQPDPVVAADLGELANGSIAPTAVVPAFATTTSGVSPASRSAETADRSASGRIRASRSVGITRTWSGRKPSARAARASDECDWSERYRIDRSSIAPIRASRAHASAVRFAADPPETSTPDAPVRIADPFAYPVEDHQLEHRRPGRAEPPARVEVECARDQVAEGAGPRALAGDEREIARMADLSDEREDVVLEVGEDLLERGRLLGRAAGEPRPELVGVR